MAKAKKTIKKAVHSVKKKVKKVAEKVVTPPAPPTSKVRDKIKDLAGQRRDASIIWEEITDNHSDEDIRELIRSKGFGTLLGNVS